MASIHRTPLMVAACAGIFFFGIVLALLGTLFGLPGMRAKLGISMSEQGNLFMLLYFGVLVATLAVGPTIDRYGNKAVLTFSALAVGLALAGFAAANSFRFAAGCALLMGLGGGGLNTSTNVLVSDLYDQRRGAMLNILGIFFGFGALCMPFVAASLAQTFTVEQLLLTAAAPAIGASVAFAALKFPAAREAHTFAFGDALRSARHPGVLLMALLLLCASGNEASIGGWTSTHLAQQGASTQTATFVLASFWGSLMAGRLLASRILQYISKERLVLLSGAGSIVSCAMVAWGPTVVVQTIGVILTGMTFAPVFPTTLAIAGDRYARFSGSVFSVLFAVALVGGMTFPWAIGQLAERSAVRVGLTLPIVGAMALTALAWMVGREKAGSRE